MAPIINNEKFKIIYTNKPGNYYAVNTRDKLLMINNFPFKDAVARTIRQYSD